VTTPSFVPGADAPALSDRTALRDPLSLPAELKSSLKLLIVDDDRTLREGCASVLEVDGYNVTSVGRGDEALDLVRRRKFDLVLVDLYMTPVSGMEILQATLEGNRDTIVVMMTGNPSVSTSIEALRLGAWDYLPKPFSASHLQVLVGRAAHAVMVSSSSSSSTATATRSRSSASRRRSARPWNSPARLRRPTPP
jgi:DNA-binding NtrC family response regulator